MIRASGARGPGFKSRSSPTFFFQTSNSRQLYFFTDSFSICRTPDKREASIAQWQSTGLVNQGSRVQSSLEASFLEQLTSPITLTNKNFRIFSFCPRLSTSLFSSVVEHWSRKPGVVGSIPTGGIFWRNE